MRKYPGSLPRKMYWSDEVEGHAACPDCGAVLESEHHTYLMAIRQGDEIDFSLMGTDAGYFCGKCPLVVLNQEKFESIAELVAPPTGDARYVVMGIVDLDAVPDDKRHLPFDDDTNPVPLVRFTNLGE